MKAIVYNEKGKQSGDLTLPQEVFGLPWNADLVHQVISSMKTAARKPYAHTKTRGEVRGGGKKPWQQKGLGRARHGSIRSPIWVGGGIAHGPRNERNFDRKVNKKMRAKALYTILSRKFKDGEIVFVDSLSMKEPKTKIAVETFRSFSNIPGLEKLSSKKSSAMYIALAEKSNAIEKSFRNMKNISVEEARNMNPIDILDYKYVVFLNPQESIKAIAGKFDK